uniref:Uncharacterized protein n=1 Tax=Anopheles atroparvus TaxID=41427 RepID=A0A182IJG1_ANOAO
MPGSTTLRSLLPDLEPQETRDGAGEGEETWQSIKNWKSGCCVPSIASDAGGEWLKTNVYLVFEKPPIVVLCAEPSPSTDARQGKSMLKLRFLELGHGNLAAALLDSLLLELGVVHEPIVAFLPLREEHGLKVSVECCPQLPLSGRLVPMQFQG